MEAVRHEQTDVLAGCGFPGKFRAVGGYESGFAQTAPAVPEYIGFKIIDPTVARFFSVLQNMAFLPSSEASLGIRF